MLLYSYVRDFECGVSFDLSMNYWDASDAVLFETNWMYIRSFIRSSEFLTFTILSVGDAMY